MPTYLENLIISRDKVAQELADIDFANSPDTPNAGGSPNSQGEGINHDHQAYRKSLTEDLDRFNALIVEQQSRDSGDIFESYEV